MVYRVTKVYGEKQSSEFIFFVIKTRFKKKVLWKFRQKLPMGFHMNVGKIFLFQKK